mgnify:CR=1 FL=1
MLFRKETRPLWFRALNAVPVMFVLALIIFEVSVYLRHIKVVRSIPFGFSAMLVLITYLKTVWTCPGVVVVDHSSSNNQQSSYCHECQRVKPPSYHHCKVCNTCIRRMDHHCPWVGNCVGEHNRKYFYQFLMWTLVATGQILFDEGVGMIIKSLHRGGSMAIAKLGALTVFSAVFLLACVQTYLLCIGMTSVELVKYWDGELQSGSSSRSSCLQNWRDVMGPRMIDWICPTTPQYDNPSRSSEYRPVGVELTV